MGTQTADTIAVSNDTITATVDDIIGQILVNRKGVEWTLYSTHGMEGGGRLYKRRVLELAGQVNQLKRMHLREHRELLQSQKKLRQYYNDTAPSASTLRWTRLHLR